MRSKTMQTKKFMHDFWKGPPRNGFFPWPPKGASDALWLWNQVTDLFREQVLRYRWPVLYSALAIAGLVFLSRRNRFGAFLLFRPFSVTVLAAVAPHYPLRTLLVLL